jgi:hypothetical protein
MFILAFIVTLLGPVVLFVGMAIDLTRDEMQGPTPAWGVTSGSLIGLGAVLFAVAIWRDFHKSRNAQ